MNTPQRARRRQSEHLLRPPPLDTRFTLRRGRAGSTCYGEGRQDWCSRMASTPEPWCSEFDVKLPPRRNSPPRRLPSRLHTRFLASRASFIKTSLTPDPIVFSTPRKAISLPRGSPLLHKETHQIQGLFKHNPRTINSPQHQGQRLNALNELGGILNDLAYFRLPQSKSFESQERKKPPSRKKSGCWENAKRDTGWTYWQCKDVFKQAPSSGLRFREIDNHAVLDQFNEIKSNDEAYLFLVNELSEGNKSKKHKTILWVVTAWQRQDEIRAVLCWGKSFRAQRDKIARLCTEPYRSMIMPSLDTWYFGPLRRMLSRWLVNACEERLSATVAAKKLADKEDEMIRAFTVTFTQAVDDDDDGALSLCELKSAELGTSNPMFVKAAIWLQTNRNFQKYAISSDVNGVGVISTPELEAAMKVFLKDHWKFDGVLW